MKTILQPSMNMVQKATAYTIYRDHLVDNHSAYELADMFIAKMAPRDLDKELQNVVELCDIDEDGTY